MDRDVGERVATLHDHLVATRELPVERDAARWIGEAEAVAGDLAGEDVPAAVLAERVGHVRRLLGEVEDTGHPDADEHVAEARRLADEVLARVDDG
jgi:hypothetical protein